MKNLKAVSKFSLGRRWIKPGDIFSLDDTDAMILVGAKKAVYHTLGIKTPAKIHLAQQEDNISPITGRPKRRYNRRDMKAEE